jgi:hypothetical protein
VEFLRDENFTNTKGQERYDLGTENGKCPLEARASVTVPVSVDECPADFDGDVDTADLLFLLGAWGTPDGDVHGDGDTDTADFLVRLARGRTVRAHPPTRSTRP